MIATQWPTAIDYLRNMADSLGIGQMGSPNIGDLISLITDNIDHTYTVSASVNMTNSSKEFSLTQTYRAFLVWYTNGTSSTQFNGFIPIKAGSVLVFANMTATFAGNNITVTGTSTGTTYLDLTLIGII